MRTQFSRVSSDIKIFLIMCFAQKSLNPYHVSIYPSQSWKLLLTQQWLCSKYGFAHETRKGRFVKNVNYFFSRIISKKNCLLSTIPSLTSFEMSPLSVRKLFIIYKWIPVKEDYIVSTLTMSHILSFSFCRYCWKFFTSFYSELDEGKVFIVALTAAQFRSEWFR